MPRMHRASPSYVTPVTRTPIRIVVLARQVIRKRETPHAFELSPSSPPLQQPVLRTVSETPALWLQASGLAWRVLRTNGWSWALLVC